MPLTSQDAFRCTLVVPAYNAMPCADATVERLRRFTREHPEWCVMFVCDGCSDGTAEYLTKITRADLPRIRVESYARNRGKGHALRLGLTRASTPFKVFTDVDLAYDPEEALKLVE